MGVLVEAVGVLMMAAVAGTGAEWG